MSRSRFAAAALLVPTSCLAITLSGCKPLDTLPGGSGAPTATTTSAPPAKVTLPEVHGQNAEIVQDKLHKLGLKRVSLGSVDPTAKVVLAPANWTAVSIEPAAGSVVAVTDAVVVKVTKHP